MKKKKPTRRSQSKNSALKHKYTLKNRIEFLDYDYLDKLNEEELAWLNKFTEEELHASFEKDNKKNLNKKKEDKQRVYNINNTRNKDLFSRLKTRNLLQDISDTVLDNQVSDYEDLLITAIDYKPKKRRSNYFLPFFLIASKASRIFSYLLSYSDGCNSEVGIPNSLP